MTTYFRKAFPDATLYSNFPKMEVFFSRFGRTLGSV